MREIGLARRARKTNRAPALRQPNFGILLYYPRPNGQLISIFNVGLDFA